MGKYSRKPFYGVAKGRTIGVFTSWEDCKASVNGYPGARYKGFNNRGDATSYISGYTLMENTNRNLNQAQREDTAPLADPEPSPSLRTQMPRSFQAREALHNSTVATNNQPSTFSSNNSARTTIDLEMDEFDDEYASQPPSSDLVSSPLSNTRKRGRSTHEYHAPRPSPVHREIIDLTDSPPKKASHGHLYPHDFPSSPPSPPERPLPGSYAREQLFANAECSDEQLRILDLVAQGRNVFFTGSAGVGKSFVLNKISELLKSQGLRQFDHFFITASTGIAAVHIGGMTIHSFAGTGKGEEGVETLKEKVSRSRRLKKQWEACQVLIIDEISMLSDELFDKIDEIGRHVRKDSRPFGGIQLVLCGDFYQLPPVPDRTRRCPTCGSFNSTMLAGQNKRQCVDGKIGTRHNVAPCNRIFPKEIGYIFQSQAWKNARFEIIELTKVYRQSDNEFVTALNKTRVGKADEHTLDLFRACCRPLTHDAAIIPTRMYPIRKLVDEENSLQFDRLETPIHVYTAVDMQSSPDGTPDLISVLKDLQAPMGLKLRVGAQVMLLANLNVTGGLVNGTRGVVKEFVSMKDAEKEVAIQASERGAPNEEASNEMSAMRTFARDNPTMMFPKVMFETKETTQEVIVTPHTWSIQLGYQIQVSRIQVPLMTAWALTIHKCQGMTLEKCVLDLSRCFGFGMAYVALSRCKSLEGLQISNWNGGREIQADPVVHEFYQSIRTRRM